jgi:UDP-N-acetylglucosamine pyrophosphorylase
MQLLLAYAALAAALPTCTRTLQQQLQTVIIFDKMPLLLMTAPQQLETSSTMLSTAYCSNCKSRIQYLLQAPAIS